MTSFILANNTKYSFEKLETWILANKKQLFDGKTILRVEFKHKFQENSWDDMDVKLAIYTKAVRHKSH